MVRKPWRHSRGSRRKSRTRISAARLSQGSKLRIPFIDRNISLFSRGHQPAFAGINTFMKAPYREDIRTGGDYEVLFVGAPFDSESPTAGYGLRPSGRAPQRGAL